MEVAAGRFREDLFYRLNMVELRVPPLRERVEDIPELIEFFSSRFATKYQRPLWRPDPDTLRDFCEFGWPGNVRQLSHVIEQSYVLDSLPSCARIATDGRADFHDAAELQSRAAPQRSNSPGALRHQGPQRPSRQTAGHSSEYVDAVAGSSGHWRQQQLSSQSRGVPSLASRQALAIASRRLGAENRSHDRDPRVGPIRFPLASNRQDGVREARREVAGGVDCIARRSTKTEADAPDERSSQWDDERSAEFFLDKGGADEH